MSLDNLKLSPFLVKELYENSLTGIESVEPKDAPAKKTVQAKANAASGKGTRFLGENKKNIVVAVTEKEYPFAAEDDLNFLINILRACNISLEDIALVNCCNNSAAVYEPLNIQFSPGIILFLGTEPQQLGFPVQIPQNRIQKYKGQQYLCAPSLQQLASDKEAKKALWTALKQLFSIG